MQLTKLIAVAAVAWGVLASGSALANHGGPPPHGDDSRALSAYFGDVILPNGINLQICPGDTAAAGFGGMPFVLTSQIASEDGFSGVPNALEPSFFRRSFWQVTSVSGAKTHPPGSRSLAISELLPANPCRGLRSRIFPRRRPVLPWSSLSYSIPTTG